MFTRNKLLKLSFFVCKGIHMNLGIWESRYLCWSVFKEICDSSFNPNHIGEKYSLVILGGGGKLSHVSFLPYLFVKNMFFFIRIVAKDISYCLSSIKQGYSFY